MADLKSQRRTAGIYNRVCPFVTGLAIWGLQCGVFHQGCCGLLVLLSLDSRFRVLRESINSFFSIHFHYVSDIGFE